MKTTSSSFVLALQQNDAVAVNSLVQDTPELLNFQLGSPPKPPVCYAASRGYVESLEMLIKRGADVEERDGVGQTALHHAAANGHADCLRVLIDGWGADVGAENFEGETALSLACSTASVGEHTDEGGYYECVLRLLKKKVCVIRNRYVTLSRNYEIMVLLMDALTDNPKALQIFCSTGVRTLCFHFDILKLVIPHADSSSIDETFLKVVVICEDSPLRNKYMDLFLEHGANINKGMNVALKYSSLMTEPYRGLPGMVKYLLDHEMGVEKGGLLLAAVCQKNPPTHPEILKTLIRSGADVNATTAPHGRTVLMEMLLNGSTTIPTMRILIQHGGINLAAMDVNGDTALTYATKTNNLPMVKYIQDHLV